MDDRSFDEQTAQQWIRGIESGTNRQREQDVYPRLSAWVDRQAPASILEIGCGQGACSDRISLPGRRYTGIDPSRFLISRARELYESESRQFLVGNAYELPFCERTFDAAFSVMVWHLLRDLRTAAMEMSRVLRPGGPFLIVTANPGAYAEWTELYTNKKCAGCRLEGDLLLDGKVIDHDVLYFHALEEISNSLHLAKFEIASIEQFRKSRRGQGPDYLVAIQGTQHA